MDANAATHRLKIHDKKEESESSEYTSEAPEDKKKPLTGNNDIARIVDSEIALHLTR